MLHLTLDQVRDTAREVVATNPDYVYRDTHEQCVYAEQDQGLNLVPSCLVGHVLHRLGIPLEEMAHNMADSVMLIGDLEADGLVEESRDTAVVSAYLLIAQEQQDKAGVRWADALRHAEEWAEVEFPS
jgi:hypothetical protein